LPTRLPTSGSWLSTFSTVSRSPLIVPSRPSPPSHADWLGSGSAADDRTEDGRADDTGDELAGLDAGAAVLVAASAGAAAPTVAASTAADAAQDRMFRRLFTTYSVSSN
jgi:hypothetical protein